MKVGDIVTGRVPHLERSFRRIGRVTSISISAFAAYPVQASFPIWAEESIPYTESELQVITCSAILALYGLDEEGKA